MDAKGCNIIRPFFKRAYKNHSCEIQLITLINDWAKISDKGGQDDTFISDFEKKNLAHSFMNVSYMAMVLVGRH